MKKDNGLVRDIRVFIASCYDAFTTLHGFHWNVEGAGFFNLHEFFQQNYEKLHESIDDFAERLQALGFYAPGSLKTMLDLSILPTSQEENLSAEKMLEIFCKNTDSIVLQAKKMIVLCESERDFVTQDMFINFAREQEKFLWMARSYLKR